MKVLFGFIKWNYDFFVSIVHLERNVDVGKIKQIRCLLQEQQYMGMATIFKKTLYLMELLARENSAVQETLFEHIDDLLEVQIVPSNLAIALKEVTNKIPFYFDIKKSVLSLFKDLYCTSIFFL